MNPNSTRYYARHGYCAPQIEAPPAPGLGLVVVIPALAEPELPATLASLWSAEAPACAVEVIVVVNAGENSDDEVRRANQETLAGLRRWEKHHPHGPRLHVLHHPRLPARHAGVGLARKIGMDEAAARLEAAGNPRGIIAGLDADCSCASNYLRALERHFQVNAASPACSITFEHDFEAVADPLLREGIIHYELFLRYYNLALKFAGHPFAFHTLGSCMAVRADAYQQQGGMNRRKAAEDFYFLSKFMSLGGFSEIRDTVVYPSARVSGRVPFGTGKAMGAWRRGGGIPAPTYHPAIFRDLGVLLGRAEELYELEPAHLPRWLEALPPSMAEFLGQAEFARAWREMQANCAAPHTFAKRFYRWFDRFRVLKYVHFVHGRFQPRVPLTEAYGELMGWWGKAPPGPHGWSDTEEMLLHARSLERGAGQEENHEGAHKAAHEDLPEGVQSIAGAGPIVG